MSTTLNQNLPTEDFYGHCICITADEISGINFIVKNVTTGTNYWKWTSFVWSNKEGSFLENRARRLTLFYPLNYKYSDHNLKTIDYFLHRKLKQQQKICISKFLTFSSPDEKYSII